MARTNVALHGFNAGQISLEALSRTDVERTKFGAETMLNFLPNPSGAMTVRPGTRYLGHTQADNFVQLIPFVKNIDQMAVVELTDGVMRAWVNDVPVTRVAVSSAVTNGTFNADVASWNDADDAGGTSNWLAGGYMQLLGDGSNGFARRYQEITVAAPDLNKEHAIRIVVTRGPIIVRVGTTATGDNLVAETILRTGHHSLALTPAANFFIQVASKASVPRLIDSITIEAAGIMTVPTIWPQAALAAHIKYDQIEDVIFCAGGAAYPPQRIERRAQGRSWSVCFYAPDDGPFLNPDSSGISLTPSGLTGVINLTASRDYFNSSTPGTLFHLVHGGQIATATISAEDTYSSSIRIAGITAARAFAVVITGTFVATLTLQKSYGAPGAWVDHATYTTPTTTTISDGLDNQIVYYRIGIKTGNYTSGTAVASLIYSYGTQHGVVRALTFTSATVVVAEVLATVGRAEATSEWREGEWSLNRGYPRTVAYFDGRLWWGLDSKINGSVSDAFESFDHDFEGDAGPINRSVGKGSAVWMLPMGRLLVGSAIQETSIRSSGFDTPLTPTDFSYKACGTEGGAGVVPAVVDGKAIIVQRGLTRLLLETFDVNAQDFVPEDLTRLCEDLCISGIKCIAIQRQPHTRVWVILADGSAAVLTYQAKDGVVAWSKVVTAGTFEFVTCLPGADGEDKVYFSVVRIVSSVPKRFIEKLSKETACVGGTITELMDSLVLYGGAPTNTISGLDHLNGNQVVVWGDGIAIVDGDAPITVAAGVATLPGGATTIAAAVGLPYTPEYKSHKLAYGSQLGTALSQRKRVDHLGMILKNTAWKGFYFGMDFTAGGLVQIQPDYQGAAVAATTIFSTYDFDMNSFPGQWDTDSRVCIAVRSPYPATVCSLQVGMVTEEVGMEIQSGSGSS